MSSGLVIVLNNKIFICLIQSYDPFSEIILSMQNTSYVIVSQCVYITYNIKLAENQLKLYIINIDIWIKKY